MTSPQVQLADFDFQRIANALGTPPPVAYAAAHAYPASAPAYETRPCAERDRPVGDSLRLYVHIPYCHYRCSFCFFAVQVGAKRAEMERYVRALRRELEWAKQGTPLAQLFVGGGTPTALPADLLDEILTAIFDHLPSRGDNLHVVEASPDSITPEHLDVMKRRGIGRVSMGTQTLEDEVLGSVRRKHTAQQTLDACRMIVDNDSLLNIDLMYGLPGQTHESFRRDFSAIAGQGVQSLTVYDLRVNEQTPVSRILTDLERLELERLVEWRLFVQQTAAELGFTQTRWHTFKRLDTIAARHTHAPHHDKSGRGYQFGIGMSARSHLGTNVYRNHVSSPTYIERIESNRSPVEEVIELQEADRRTQFVTSALGDGRAVHCTEYESVFGNPFADDFSAPLGRLLDAGLMEQDGSMLSLSETGKLLHDRVMFNFYPPRALQWLASRKASRRTGMVSKPPQLNDAG